MPKNIGKLYIHLWWGGGGLSVTHWYMFLLCLIQYNLFFLMSVSFDRLIASPAPFLLSLIVAITIVSIIIFDIYSDDMGPSNCFFVYFIDCIFFLFDL